MGKFFEKDQIMPSPWTEPVPKVNLLAMIEEEKSVLPSESKRHGQFDIQHTAGSRSSHLRNA